MINIQNLVLLSTLATCALAFAGEYIPKSYYTIDENGHKSDVIYFRSKRDVELFPLLRLKRGGGSSASSHNAASASSSSSSKAGSNVEDEGFPPYFGVHDYFPSEIIDPGFNPIYHKIRNLGGGGPGGGSGSHSHSFASSSSSSSSGSYPPGYGGFNTGGNLGYQGPVLFSRFGEDTGTGVKVSGSAQGPKGAFSSSSSSIDSDGKIKYSVQSGKY